MMNHVLFPFCSPYIECFIATVILTLAFFILRKTRYVKEYGLLIAVCVLFSVLTLTDLGSAKTPQNAFMSKSSDDYVIFKTEPGVSQIVAMGIEAEDENRNRVGIGLLRFEGSYDNRNYIPIGEMDSNDFMKWISLDIDNNYPYIRLTFSGNNGVVNELAFIHSGNTLLSAEIIETNNPETRALIDEQDCLDYPFDYEDETYFDEIYHVRNAYEIAHHLNLYTAVHPLLGTRLIALGIKIFGMNPFGYRFMGALVSVLCIPVFYALAYAVLKNRHYANMATVLFASDFMHFTTGRIATLEPFSVFWILLMYLFMALFYNTRIYTQPKKAYICLGLCGMTMAIAWATKWTCLYASIGLAVLFFIHLIRESIREKKTFINCLPMLMYCCVFFVLIPVIVYFLAYRNIRIYPQTPQNINEYIQQILDYIRYSFTYHRDLTSTHPFASKWYMWMANIRPIWYYVQYFKDSIETISCFNNPLINLFGLCALFYALYKTIKEKRTVYLFPLLAYLSVLLPWVFIQRTTYSYHYYPCIPFLILIICLFFKENRLHKKTAKAEKIFMILVVLLFILFLPVIGGFKAPTFYATKLLRWLPSWYFGA